MKKISQVFFLAFIVFQKAAIAQKLSPEETVDQYCMDRTVDHVFFAPDDSEIYKSIIRGLIQMTEAQGKIRMAAFRLTDKDICQDLIAAHARGVSVEAVFDPGAVTTAFYSGVFLLCKAGIPVYQYIPVGLTPASSRSLLPGGRASYLSIMHQKTMIFENTCKGKNFVVFGSLNFTTAGFYGNEEAVQVRNKPELITAFLDHFELLKKRSYVVSLPKVVEQSTLRMPFVFLRMIQRFAKK